MTAEHGHTGADLENPDSHHEGSDVNVRAIFGFAAALTVVALVMNLIVWVLFQYYQARESAYVPPDYPMSIAQRDRMPPSPRLQTNPRQDLRDLRAQEDAILGTYGWSDRNSGAVRIPIEQAMKLTLQRGLPARQEAPPDSGTSSSTGAANSGRMIGVLQPGSRAGTPERQEAGSRK